MTSKKIQPTIIGIFVVLSCLLFVAGVIIFGGKSFFNKENIVIAYFEDSLKGLSIGAPVTYRGVTIGQVKEIKIHILNAGTNDHKVIIPVLIALNARQSISMEGGELYSAKEADVFLKVMCEQGLRAKLKLQSLVTGRRYIDLAIYENTTPVYRDQNGKYFELPTLPSESHQVSKLVESINFSELYGMILNTFTSLDKLTADLAETMSTENAKGLVSELSTTTRSLNSILSKVDSDISPILQEVKNGLGQIDHLAGNADQVLSSFDTRLQPLIDEMSTTVAHFDTMLEQAGKVLSQAGKTLNPSSPLYFRLTEAMRQLEKTAASVQNLSDFLYRNPDALILGLQSTGDSSDDQ